MDAESGFFNRQDDAGKSISMINEQLSEFKLVYASASGYSRVFIAKKGVRVYVVKCLKAEYAHDVVARAALRKEYESTCYIESPRVARTYDFLDVPGYGPSILMEYCPGQTLGKIIENKIRLSDGAIQTIVTELIRAVEDIHTAGVVHRDIKPDNVVCNSDPLTVKIIDFGCADGEAFFILKGAAGTEGYARPETLQSDYATSVKDDYYSLGMTLSALMPLCSRSSAKAVASISTRLCAGEKVVSDAVKSFFERKHYKHWLLVVGLLIAIVPIIIWSLRDKRVETTYPEQPVVENKKTPAQNRPMTEVLVQQEPSVDTVEAPEIIAIPEETPKVSPPKSSEKEDAEIKSAEKEIEPEREIKPQKEPNSEKVFDDEYGVRYEEARYGQFFRQNEFDRITVIYADSYMSVYYGEMHNTRLTQSRRDSAALMFRSFDGLWSDVEPKIIKQFGEENIMRAKGISKQRQKFWVEENYVPQMLKMLYE